MNWYLHLNNFLFDKEESNRKRCSFYEFVLNKSVTYIFISNGNLFLSIFHNSVIIFCVLFAFLNTV